MTLYFQFFSLKRYELSHISQNENDWVLNNRRVLYNAENKASEKLKKFNVIIICFKDDLPVISLIINVINFICNNKHGFIFLRIIMYLV